MHTQFRERRNGPGGRNPNREHKSGKARLRIPLQRNCTRLGPVKRELDLGKLECAFYFFGLKLRGVYSMLSNKKAQGMSLNTVIIAIVVLIVLVVLVMIFTGYFGKVFTPGVQSCATQGGKCVSACNTDKYGAQIGSANDCNAPLVCCSSVGGFKEFVGSAASAPAAGGVSTQAGAPGSPSSPLLSSNKVSGSPCYSAKECALGLKCPKPEGVSEGKCT